jgi:O-antigen/teichoic acid export membrane protein
MQAAHRVAKNTGILYARMAITVFISLYATRLVLAALGVADFGLFNVVGGVIAMLGFLNSSMAAATQRFMSFAQGEGDLEKVKRIFNMSTVLHAGIAVLMVLVLEIAGYFFFNGILNIAPDRVEVAKIIYHFMVVSTFFTVLSVPYEAVITSHENMMFYAILGVLESVLKLAIALYLAYSAYDHLIAYGFLMAALSIFLLVLRRIYCHRYYDECVLDLRKYYEKSLMKEISSFAGWSLLGSSSSMITNYGQGVLMNVFFGTTVNAAQGIANQVCGQLGAFASTMSKAINPVIAKSEGGGERQLMLKATMMGSKFLFLLILFFYVPVFIEMPYLFKLWLKNPPLYAIVFCRLLMIRIAFEQMSVTMAGIISAIGNIRNFQILSSLISYFPLIISYFLFKSYNDPSIVYYVYILYAIINGIVVIYFVNIVSGLPIKLFLRKVVLKSFVSLILISAISCTPIFLLEEGAVRLLYVILLSSISFCLVVWFVGLDKNEKLILQGVVKNTLIKLKLKSL